MDKLDEEKSFDLPEGKGTETTSGKGFNIKIVLFGLPLFIIQLIAVYFITANVLIPKMQGTSTEVQADSTHIEAAQDEHSETGNEEMGKFVYVIDDLIINPAGTDGKRFLLSSIGFDIKTEQNQQELKAKEILVKDAIISILSSKNVLQLGNSLYRDTLKLEISGKVSELLPAVSLNTIYFSKYILQ
ncbi:MAG: flagellar basal body-associated FliL family protein [Melioribacteraceae bacterium]|nr:flagellar basal body-associated FliL family protein [Melioribacteraceae bacterium]